MICRSSYFLQLLAAASLVMASRVHAHAGPQVRTIYFDQGGKKTTLVANRGLIFGDPDKADWQLMCNEALQIGTSDRADIAALPDGTMLAATPLGLLRSMDHGCNWQPAPGLSGWQTPALTQHPSAPKQLYLSTYAPGETGLRVSVDGGATWTMLLKGQDTDFFRYLQVARGDTNVLYAAKLSLSTTFAYSVLRSGDAGKTWQENPVTVSDTETDLELLGVSPIDADFVLAKAHAQEQATMPERLLVSHDGGKTFDVPLMLHVITAVAFSGDGKTLWLATDDGLYRSTDDARSFTRIGIIDLVSCVVERSGQLLACGWYKGLSAGMPGVGISTDGGETFSHWMQLAEVAQPLACDASSATAMTCAALWVDWQREILGASISGTSGAGGASGTLGTAGRSAATAARSGSGGAPAAAGTSAAAGGGYLGAAALLSEQHKGASCAVAQAHRARPAMGPLSVAVGLAAAGFARRRRKRARLTLSVSLGRPLT